MKKYIALIYCLVLALCLLGCTEERWLENNIENNIPEGGLPVEFVMDFAPTEIITRSGENSISVDEKTVFENGDIIQVVANFYKKGNTATDANVLRNSVCCYLIYEKDEADPIGKWVNNTNEPLYWPWESEEASFQAFYYPGYDGLLKPGSPATPVLLEDLDIYTDPLMTELVKNIPYGNAVPLEFKHKCARLILTDLESVFGSANYNELWLENKIQGQTNKNAFELSIEGTSSSGTTGIEPPYSLGFNFTAIQNDNKILIGGKTPEAESGEIESPKYVVFFLPPGDYSDVSLTRKFGRPLLSWENVDGLYDLQEGKSYTVSLNDLKGNIIIDDDDDWWKDDEGCIEDTEFDLQEFLNSISAGHSYSYIKGGKEIVVLEEIETNHIVLKKNINFKDQEYEKVDMHSTTKFDGNGHYFVGAYKPIFGSLSGELSNLGIKDSEATVNLSKENPEFGILACYNSAKIDNIRLDNIKVNVTSITDDAATYFVGTLIGDNTGSVKNMQLNNINLITNDIPIVGGHLMIGGLIGQSAENSNLENVEMSGDECINVDNNVIISGGNGNTYCGGLLGLSSSDIINCKVRANVSTEGALAMWMYTGGLVGSMRNRDNTSTGSDHLKIENSINDGTVHGGECLGIGTDDDNTTGHSSTGGIAGYTLRTDILNCKVLGYITSKIGDNHTDTDEFYTIGGLVGAVRAADTNNKEDYPQVKNNSVYAKVDETLEIDEENPEIHFSKAGWLAGIAPDNVVEDNTNIKYINTKYKNVGYSSNVSAGGQPTE